MLPASQMIQSQTGGWIINWKECGRKWLGSLAFAELRHLGRAYKSSGREAGVPAKIWTENHLNVGVQCCCLSKPAQWCGTEQSTIIHFPSISRFYQLHLKLHIWVTSARQNSIYIHTVATSHDMIRSMRVGGNFNPSGGRTSSDCVNKDAYTKIIWKTYLYCDPRLLCVLMNTSLYVTIICYNIYSTPLHLKSETLLLCPKHLAQATKRFNV
jgi:hypothetical protein